MVPTLCAVLKYNLHQLIHQRFGRVSITSLKRMARKVLVKGLPNNLPGLEDL